MLPIVSVISSDVVVKAISFSSQLVKLRQDIAVFQAPVVTHLPLPTGNQRKQDEARMLGFVRDMELMTMDIFLNDSHEDRLRPA